VGRASVGRLAVTRGDHAEDQEHRDEDAKRGREARSARGVVRQGFDALLAPIVFDAGVRPRARSGRSGIGCVERFAGGVEIVGIHHDLRTAAPWPRAAWLMEAFSAVSASAGASGGAALLWQMAAFGAPQRCTEATSAPAASSAA
jgi:hypothetical protein